MCGRARPAAGAPPGDATVGADRARDTAPSVTATRPVGVTPHVAQKQPAQPSRGGLGRLQAAGVADAKPPASEMLEHSQPQAVTIDVTRRKTID